MFSFLKNILGGGTTTPLTADVLRKGTILDVRTPGEYAGGHVAGAKNIPLQTLGQSMAKVQKMPQPIVTCCASGRRSGMAAKQLRSQGIEAINGGSWQQVNRLKQS